MLQIGLTYNHFLKICNYKNIFNNEDLSLLFPFPRLGIIVLNGLKAVSSGHHWHLLKKQSNLTLSPHSYFYSIQTLSSMFTATIHHQGQTHTIPVSADKSILESAQEHGLDLPSSCIAGVCTSCAAQILKGQVDQSQGMGMGGMGEELDAKGYVLLCVSYPQSDVEIVTEKEQEVYTIRFGHGS